jgi:hypothetical protein
MTTEIFETPAATGEKTTIRFCGVNFTLEDLEDYEFIHLFDAVVDHGSDLVERAANMPMHVYEQHKERHIKQLAENSLHIVLLDREAERRKALPASTGPDLCDDCRRLSTPIDPNELCDDCVGVCNDWEGDRAAEPDFVAA